MNTRLPFAAGLVSLLAVTSIAEAQSSYPTVYGSTGHPYGPTQAAYQYQRQYGQPSHGYGGQVARTTCIAPSVIASPLWHSPYQAFPLAAPWGASYFVGSPYPMGLATFGYTAPGPYIYGLEKLTNPGSFTPNVAPLPLSVSPVSSVSTLKTDLADGLGAIPAGRAEIDPSQRPVPPSSTAAKLKSLEKQAFGDEKLRKQQWGQAYIEYRSAIESAPDRAEAHHRLGYLMVAMNHHSSAVREFKRAVFLDPNLPQSADRPALLFGPDSRIVRTSFIHKVADWLREDIRDPDRLYLFGVLLYFEGDARGREVLEAAQRMANSSGRFTDHITAFLSAPVDKANEENVITKPDAIPFPKLQQKPMANEGKVDVLINPDEIPPAPLPPAPMPDIELDQPRKVIEPIPGLPPLKTTLP